MCWRGFFFFLFTSSSAIWSIYCRISIFCLSVDCARTIHFEYDLEINGTWACAWTREKTSILFCCCWNCTNCINDDNNIFIILVDLASLLNNNDDTNKWYGNDVTCQNQFCVIFGFVQVTLFRAFHLDFARWFPANKKMHSYI